MAPTEKEVTETRYVCANCMRVHAQRERAEECCLCEKCHKAAATHNDKGPAPIRMGTWCASCWRARRVRAVRDQIDGAEGWVSECERRLAQARAQLDARRQELAAIPPGRRFGRSPSADAAGVST